MSNALDLDKLDELHAKATPGNWFVAPVLDNKCNPYPTTYQAWAFADPAQIASYADAGENTADLDLIVALRNAYPALRAELRRLRAIEAGYAKAVEEAYREGWLDGEREGLSAGQSWSGVRFGRATAASDYETSAAKRALEPKP